MKKLVSRSKQLLLVAVCLLITAHSFGGGFVRARKNCHWYLDKFVAEASIKRSGTVFSLVDANDSGCGYAEAWVEAYFCNGPAPRKGEAIPYTSPGGNSFIAVIGSAKMRIDNNGYRGDIVSGYGRVQRDGDCAPASEVSGGHEPLDLPIDLAISPIIEPTQETDAKRHSYFTVGEIIYDDARRAFIVRNLEATLNNKPFDESNDFSSLGITLNYIQDSTSAAQAPPNGSSVILQSRLMLNNRQVIRDGFLQNYSLTAYSDYCEGTEQTDMQISEIVLPVPYNVDPDQVEVTIGGDTGNLGYGVDDFFYPSPNASSYTTVQNTSQVWCPPPLDPSIAPTQPESMQISSYPNPVIDGPVTVEVEIKEKENVQVGIFNADGVLVRKIYQGVLQGNKKTTFNATTTGLKPGIYYLRMIGKERSLSRRLIIKK